MLDDEYLDLLGKVDRLVAAFEEHPDPRTRDHALELVSLLNVLHREGLVRLLGGLRSAGGGELVDRAGADPVVRILLGLYGLADLGLPEEIPAPDAGAPIPVAGPPFRSLESVADSRGPVSSKLLTIRRRPRADWVEVAGVGELPRGTLRAVEADGIRAVLVNVEGEIHAYGNACPGSALPLELGRLEGDELHCPWHGCRYDARTGRRRDGREGRLQVLPVAVRGPSIQLAVQRPAGVKGPDRAPGAGAAGR